MENIKVHAVSFGQTFVAVFLSALGTAVMTVDPATLANPDTYTTSFIAGLILAAVRQAVKIAWEKSLPVSIGGKA